MEIKANRLKSSKKPEKGKLYEIRDNCEIEVTEDNTLIYFEDGAYADGKITAKN